ncbi:MAG: hypothetical protein WCP93_01690 [Candidatus Berkelbacteria bacterium]
MNMKSFWLTQKRFLVMYAFCFVLFVISILSRTLHSTPLLVWILLVSAILVPGFSLARICKFSVKSLSGQLVLWLGLGWMTSLGLSFLAIITGLTIHAFTIIFMVVSGLLLIISFYLELIRSHLTMEPIKWSDWFKLDNLPLLLVLIYLGFVLLDINLTGSLYGGGDAMYHLSTLRKVVENKPLTIENLAYVKDQIEIAYAFPVWHILMGFLSDLSRINMFMIWREMCVPLVAMAFVVWYWLFRQLLPTRNLALLSLFFFTAFNYNWKFGYELTTLPIPHSLMQFLLLPLLVSLALHYVFQMGKNWLFLICLGLLTILLGVVHLTGYFYFLMIMVTFLSVYWILKYREPDCRQIVDRLLQVILSTVVIIIPLAIVLQLKGHVVSNFWKSFHSVNYPTTPLYHSFASLDILVKYAYLILPLVLIFARKYRKLIFILSLFLVLPLVVNSFVGPVLMQTLGMIFMKRLYGTVVWYFPVWAIFFGFIIVLLDRSVCFIKGKWNYIANIVFYVLAIFLAWFEFFNRSVPKIYREPASTAYTSITSSDIVGTWLNHYYLFLLIPLTVFGLIIYFWFSKRFDKIFSFDETKNHGLVFCLFMIVFLIFASPAEARFVRSFDLDKIHKIVEPTTISSEKNAIGAVGGKEVIDFIKQNVPAKSVFDVSGSFFYLPELVDIHMSNYSNDADLTYIHLYENDKWDIATKISVINQAHIEYMMITGKTKKLADAQKILDQYPQYFQKIYSNNVIIYKVNRDQIIKDVPKPLIK